LDGSPAFEYEAAAIIYALSRISSKFALCSGRQRYKAGSDAGESLHVGRTVTWKCNCMDASPQNVPEAIYLGKFQVLSLE
jgi:hypothetical protein